MLKVERLFDHRPSADHFGAKNRWMSESTAKSRSHRFEPMIDASKEVFMSARSKKFNLSVSKLGLDISAAPQTAFSTFGAVRFPQAERLSKNQRPSSVGISSDWRDSAISSYSNTRSFKRECAMKELDKIVGSLKSHNPSTRASSSFRVEPVETIVNKKRVPCLTHSKLTTIKFDLLRSQANLMHCNFFKKPASSAKKDIQSSPRVDFNKSSSLQQYLALKKDSRPVAAQKVKSDIKLASLFTKNAIKL